MSPKKIAIRTCVGCQQRRLQEELWDFGEGRHGYLCYDQECFEKAVTKNTFSRALKRKVSEKEQNELKQEFEKEVKKRAADSPSVRPSSPPMAGSDGNGPC